VCSIIGVTVNHSSLLAGIFILRLLAELLIIMAGMYAVSQDTTQILEH